MSGFAGILTAFLMLHAAYSYILLTANLEDVQTLAKQLAASPVVEQINKIWRRASSQFSQHLSKGHKRANDDLDVEGDAEAPPASPNKGEHKGKPAEPGKSNTFTPEEQKNVVHRRKESADDELVALGKNASRYLTSIRKMFENI